MGKYGSANFAVLLVDGFNLLAAKVKGVTHKIEALTEPALGLGDGWDSVLPTGIQRATLTQDQAFFDDATAGIHAAWQTPSSVPRVVAFAPAGNTIGAPLIGFEGTYAQTYSVTAVKGALTKADVTYQVSGKLDRGRILSDHVSKAASWNTKTDGFPVEMGTDPLLTAIPIVSSGTGSPATITTAQPHGLTTTDLVEIRGHTGSTPSINATYAVTVVTPTTFTISATVTVGGTGGYCVPVNSRNGGVGYQLVSALTGITGFVGKIRSSPDDTTYADLLTFANVTAAQTAQRVTVAGTIDRWLSYSGTITGTGSITVCVGFSRG